MEYSNRPGVEVVIGDSVRITLEDNTAVLGTIVKVDDVLKVKVISNPQDPATASLAYYNAEDYDLIDAFIEEDRDPTNYDTLKDRADVMPIIE